MTERRPTRPDRAKKAADTIRRVGNPERPGDPEVTLGDLLEDIGFIDAGTREPAVERPITDAMRRLRKRQC